MNRQLNPWPSTIDLISQNKTFWISVQVSIFKAKFVLSFIPKFFFNTIFYLDIHISGNKLFFTLIFFSRKSF